ncbi:NlpC/P60 family protein [Chondromyces apiculatus]|uniref:Peptidoglycan binding-like domain-containing protein n=1 Tax=Chondromyces apiculatus DSM 436 TaxID=1192034 RepID=A0A017SXR9_9BACT|nr:TIGR02594 family protein [Chondromyces apiculatus]EYF01420.1 Hypothetical protein CAP_8351 [Chondromyces apiculatus DSM 436]
MERPTLRVGYGFPTSEPHLNGAVRVLQTELTRRGYRIGGADGKFGNVTESAVKHFQRHLGVSDTGVVTATEWAALLDGPVTNVGSSFVPPGSSRDEPPLIDDVPDNPPWLRVAKAERDVKTVAGDGSHPRIVEYHATTSLGRAGDEYAWCSSFINWVLKQVGITGTNNAGAASWVNWGTATQPRVGAIVVIFNQAMKNSSETASGNHCSFLIEETSSHYIMLGGNQSKSVKVKQYSKESWELKGRRWPTGY